MPTHTSLRGKARGLTMAWKALQGLLRAPPQPTVLSSYYPFLHRLLPSPWKHQALSPLGLCTCWFLCQKKSPWQLCTYSCYLGLCSNVTIREAFPDLLKDQLLPPCHYPSLSPCFLSVLLITAFIHSFILICLLLGGRRDFIGFTAVSPGHRIVPAMWEALINLLITWKKRLLNMEKSLLR